MLTIRCSKIRFLLAKIVLEQYFSKFNANSNLQQRRRLARFCIKNNTSGSKNMYRSYLKIQRWQINRALVQLELRSLPTEQQEFIRLYYQEQRTLDSISYKLHYSKTVLSIWQSRILEDIDYLLRYTLSPKDIFQPIKTLNLLRIIDQRQIALLYQNHIEVDQDFLRYLSVQRKKYRKLLNTMHLFWDYQESDVYPAWSKDACFIIREKLHHPFDSLEMIAQRMGLSPSKVSRVLDKYREACNF